MMRVCPPICALALSALAAISSPFSVHAGTPYWMLPDSDYPPAAHLPGNAHASIGEIPSNRQIDAIFRLFHVHSYEQLGRLDHRGWMGGGGVEDNKPNGKQLPGVNFFYGVSYYPSHARTVAAYRDASAKVHLTRGPRDGHGSITSLTFTGVVPRKQYATYNFLSKGTVTVELWCWIPLPQERSRLGATMRRYCARQRATLFEKLLKFRVR
jgi:hypothetical protein